MRPQASSLVQAIVRAAVVRDGRTATLEIRMVDQAAMAAGLPGAGTVLAAAGFGTEEMLRWLFTPDDSLPGTPLAALRAGRRREVRRRAQALAL